MKGFSAPLRKKMRRAKIRKKQEIKERKKEEGRPRSLFWSLKSDFCKGFKILRLVCEFISQIILPKCHYCMLIQVRVWFKRVMAWLSMIMKWYSLKDENFSELSRVLIPYVFLHANFEGLMSRIRPMFLHESCSFMCLVYAYQISASLVG